MTTSRDLSPETIALRDGMATYDVQQEVVRIRKHYGPLASTHEGLGVLLEEFEELKDEIKKNPREYQAGLMRKEAVQVAAVAIRICSDLAHDESATRPRTVMLRDGAAAQCDRMRARWLNAEKAWAEEVAKNVKLEAEVERLREDDDRLRGEGV